MGVLLRLPDAVRADLREPLGPIFTDAEALLREVSGPLVAVGDVVTYHLERAGRRPDVALIDHRTERRAVDQEVAEALADADVVVENPAATLTEDLLTAIRDGLDADGPVRIRVEGEEDLATLPAVLAAPDGASVVYGQPGEGMVHVRVTPETRARVRDLLGRLEGDVARAVDLLGAR